jgi:hypothetical protein
LGAISQKTDTGLRQTDDLLPLVYSNACRRSRDLNHLYCHDLPHFEKLLGDGKRLGCEFSYAEKPSQDGLTQAFIIGEQFRGKDKVALVLGDNIFHVSGLSTLLNKQ